MAAIAPEATLLCDDPVVTDVVAAVAARPQGFVAALAPACEVSVAGYGEGEYVVVDGVVSLVDAVTVDPWLAAAEEALGDDNWTQYGESMEAAITEVARRAQALAAQLVTATAFALAFLLARPAEGARSPSSDSPPPLPLGQLVPLSGAGSTHAPPAASPHLIPVEARAA